jgi:hypothetical protein
MKWITVFILTVLSMNIYGSQKITWEIEYGWRSSWIVSNMQMINSLGEMRITQFSPFQDKICGIELTKQELADINYSMNSIPSELPEGTIVQYIDRCHDEKENYIYITQENKKRGFIFTRLNECRSTKVPSWLSDFYKKLEKIQKRFSDCIMPNKE